MQQTQLEAGKEELRAVWRKRRSLLFAAGLFSVFVNLLMLTGPLYMLQVYDRVLGSRSVETLIGLTILMAFLFLIMGLVDYARGRVLARIGANFQTTLERRVFSSSLRRLAKNGANASRTNNLRDLEAVQKMVTSPAFAALFDIPWTPVFLFAIAVFHPWLGILALSGGAILVFIAVLNQIYTHPPVAKAQTATLQAEHMLAQLQGEAEMVRALGMQEAAFERWHKARHDALRQSLTSADHLADFRRCPKHFACFYNLPFSAWAPIWPFRARFHRVQ